MRCDNSTLEINESVYHSEKDTGDRNRALAYFIKSYGLIEDEIEQQKMEIIGKLEKGQVLEGVVKNITSYGVFIDLGGVDGLIHITDLSWGRVSNPNEIVKEGEKINVVILDFDDEKKRIALGLKQLTPHPWEALNADLKVGDKISGKVVVMADYGAFVEVAPGVEGLIHVSEMSWSQHLRSANDFLKVGQEVEAVVLTLDRDERKMSLGLKQLKNDPWETIDTKYAVGTRHFAKVRNFTNFGVFVEIEEGVDGLIHISDLSWTKKIKHPNEFTQIGAEIEVAVLEIDKENRRLSLGHKQLEENPWEELAAKYGVDTVVSGKVAEVNYLTETGRFEVICSIANEFQFPEDSKMIIYAVDIMGTRGVRIDFGESESYAQDGATLTSEYEQGLLDGLGASIQPLLAKVGNTLDSLSNVVSGVNSMLSEDNMKHISRTIANLDRTMSNVSGIAKTINGKSSELDAFVDNLSTFSGKLEGIATKVDSTVAGVNGVVGQLNESDLQGLVSSFKDLVENINDPDGSINKLMKDDSVYNSVDSLLNDVNVLVKKIQENPKKYLKISVF